MNYRGKKRAFGFARQGIALLAYLCGAAMTPAHTLPISYLQIVPDAEYLHVELVFNPFELRFLSEYDDDANGALDYRELKTHGTALAQRLAGGLKISTGKQLLKPETAGMDPDLSGHHVKLRLQYKADVRRAPLTIESRLNEITSSSHLVQVTYAGTQSRQLAQLDSQSRSVTFQPVPPVKPAEPSNAQEKPVNPPVSPEKARAAQPRSPKSQMTSQGTEAVPATQ